MKKIVRYCFFVVLTGFIVLTVSMPPKVKADPLPQPVIELFGPASIEQITKTAQLLLATNDMFNQLKGQTDTVTAQFKVLAAYTGNPKLIEMANSDPLNVLRTSVTEWIQNFNTNLSKMIIGWLTGITSKKTTADEASLNVQQKKDNEQGVNDDLGLPDPTLDTGDKEQNQINSIVIKRNKFYNVSKEIRRNYFLQKIDPKTGKITEYQPNDYPDDSTPKFLFAHQNNLYKVQEQLRSPEYQQAINPALQQEITNQLLMEIAQSNLKILQALQDLVKTQYLTNSIAQEKAINDAYNQYELEQSN